MTFVKIGMAGPVGAGKSALIESITRAMKDDYSIGIVTNDIYTKADSSKLARSGLLEESRIIGVETGGCPHLAIREDVSMNNEAINELVKRHPDLEIIFVESGGDNLSASFSPDLVDGIVYVISVAEGDDIPTKGGPGIQRSDMLVITKTDLAPYVKVDMEKFENDVQMVRKGRAYSFQNLMTDENINEMVQWIKEQILLES